MQIRTYREKAGISQTDAAKKAGISKQMASKIENGGNASLKTLITYCSGIKIQFSIKMLSDDNVGTEKDR